MKYLSLQQNIDKVYNEQEQDQKINNTQRCYDTIYQCEDYCGKCVFFEDKFCGTSCLSSAGGAAGGTAAAVVVILVLICIFCPQLYVLLFECLCAMCALIPDCCECLCGCLGACCGGLCECLGNCCSQCNKSKSSSPKSKKSKPTNTISPNKRIEPVQNNQPQITPVTSSRQNLVKNQKQQKQNNKNQEQPHEINIVIRDGAISKNNYNQDNENQIKDELQYHDEIYENGNTYYMRQAQQGQIPKRHKQCDPSIRNNDNQTVAMILAAKGIVPPKDWYHNSTLVDKNNDTVALLLAANKIPPKHPWTHNPKLQNNQGKTVQELLMIQGVTVPKEWQCDQQIFQNPYQQQPQQYNQIQPAVQQYQPQAINNEPSITSPLSGFNNDVEML